MHNTTCSVVISCIAGICAAGFLQAQEFPTRQIRVVDPKGTPISGAIVDAFQINERYSWPTHILKSEYASTDVQGFAAMRYPKYASYAIEQIAVESITVRVSHSDFCTWRGVVPIAAENGKPYDIALSPGVELKLSAVDEKGDPVTEPFAVMQTRTSGASRWKRPAPDKAQCRSIENGNHQIMLVQLRADDRNWFSEVLTYRFDRNQEPEVAMEDIEMRPGIAIRGQLGANVPRPIKNGRVIASHVPLPAGSNWDIKLPSLIYYRTIQIDASGAFQFNSMPRTGTVQLIASCDGWTGSYDDKSRYVVGDSFEVDDKDLSVELKMQPTFDAKIRILDKQGAPVSDATLACSPNIQYSSGGASRMGGRPDSTPALKSQFSILPMVVPGNYPDDFQGVTNKDGEVSFRNLPRIRRSSLFSIWSSDKNAKKIVSAGQDEIEVKLPEPNENSVEFEAVVDTENK